MVLESIFKRKLIEDIQRQFPGAIVIKIDANHTQGILDNFVIWEDRWAAFEAKQDIKSPHRPNQDYYVNLLNNMSLASFVYPQNKEWFLNELQQTFRYSSRPTSRISIRK